MSPHRIILGVVGKFGTGKDELANYLAQKHGFTHVSTGDIFRAYLRSVGGNPASRDELTLAANTLRAKEGADYTVRTAISSTTANLVISGIRAMGEAQAVLDHHGKLIACIADDAQRYAMAKRRNRLGETVTYEKFMAQEAVELTSTDPNAQNLSGVIAMAQHTILNDFSNLFYSKIDELIKSI